MCKHSVYAPSVFSTWELYKAMARPFKCVCDRNPSNFQFKIMFHSIIQHIVMHGAQLIAMVAR